MYRSNDDFLLDFSQCNQRTQPDQAYLDFDPDKGLPSKSNNHLGLDCYLLISRYFYVGVAADSGVSSL